MNEYLVNALFDILEHEAEYKYYLPVNGEFAEEPALIICHGVFAKLGKTSWTVYFGRGIADWTFGTLREAQAKVLEIISKMRKPITKVKQVDRRGRIKIINLGEAEK